MVLLERSRYSEKIFLPLSVSTASYFRSSTTSTKRNGSGLRSKKETLIDGLKAVEDIALLGRLGVTMVWVWILEVIELWRKEK
jgi:hypothetical protein